MKLRWFSRLSLGVLFLVGCVSMLYAVEFSVTSGKIDGDFQPGEQVFTIGNLVPPQCTYSVEYTFRDKTGQAFFGPAPFVGAFRTEVETWFNDKRTKMETEVTKFITNLDKAKDKKTNVVPSAKIISLVTDINKALLKTVLEPASGELQSKAETVLKKYLPKEAAKLGIIVDTAVKIDDVIIPKKEGFFKRIFMTNLNRKAALENEHHNFSYPPGDLMIGVQDASTDGKNYLFTYRFNFFSSQVPFMEEPEAMAFDFKVPASLNGTQLLFLDEACRAVLVEERNKFSTTLHEESRKILEALAKIKGTTEDPTPKIQPFIDEINNKLEEIQEKVPNLIKTKADEYVTRFGKNKDANLKQNLIVVAKTAKALVGIGFAVAELIACPVNPQAWLSIFNGAVDMGKELTANFNDISKSFEKVKKELEELSKVIDTADPKKGFWTNKALIGAIGETSAALRELRAKIQRTMGTTSGLMESLYGMLIAYEKIDDKLKDTDVFKELPEKIDLTIQKIENLNERLDGYMAFADAVDEKLTIGRQKTNTQNDGFVLSSLKQYISGVLTPKGALDGAVSIYDQIASLTGLPEVGAYVETAKNLLDAGKEVVNKLK